MGITGKWRDMFLESLYAGEHANEILEAALAEELTPWTKALTEVVVSTCQQLGWLAAAKGHKLDVMPERYEEYLGIDVMAFPASGRPWRWPVAAIELENSRRDERIAYSLWKVLNISCELRVVFCYRPEPKQGTGLVRSLERQVIDSLEIEQRQRLGGSTLVVVGYRNKSATFPHGFFKWWFLNTNLGMFEQHKTGGGNA